MLFNACMYNVLTNVNLIEPLYYKVLPNMHFLE